MSIIIDKVRQEGDSIFIKSDPTTGVLALTAFADIVTGVDDTHTFVKTFRYSVNGFLFSDWLLLTIGNITSIVVARKDTIVIEIQYAKQAPSGDIQLAVTSATIGTVENPILPGYYFKNSVFYQYFGSEDLTLLNWYINVLEKLYRRGLVPSYIERLNEFGKPDDFVEFWRGICKFFAYYVKYARQFQNFYQDEVLLAEYLEQRGMKTTPSNSLVELNLLMKNFYNQVFKRGGIHIVDKVAEGAAIDGELLRLIYFKSGDEFLFNPSRPEHFGWNLGNSSPLYRGMTIHDNVNKMYEPGIEPVDISNYPTTGAVVIVNDAAINKNVIQITGNGGIQDMDGIPRIPVSEYMDYEFFLFIKKTDGNNLVLGFDAFDINGNSIHLESRTDGSVLNTYFVNRNLPRTDKYIGVRVILYNKLKPLSANDNLNLRMVDGVAFIVPKIIMTEGNANIYNIRFVPMISPYSKGFVQVNNFVECWLKNNNNKLSIEEVRKYIRHYLVPYDSQLQITQTELAGDYSV